MQLYVKKKIPLTWSMNPSDPWGTFRSVRSSESPHGDPAEPTRETFVQSVISEQKQDSSYGIIYSSIVLGCSILVFLIIVTLVFIKRRRSKNDEKSGSILVYPSSQGNTPHFLTKEIHFSLPPLRSSSMGNLNEPCIDDSDVDTECLLLPTTHNQRSNSFSCYGLGVIEPALYRSTLDLDEIQWPEGHIGRLWFSLRYEPSTEKLLVSLLKAKNLPSRTVGTVNSCDPFVRLHLLPDERRYLQSKQKKKTCNPYFDETLVFQVSSKEMSERILKLTVIDGGRAKKRGEIGHVTFSLKDLDVGDGSEQQLFKMDLEKEPHEIRSDLGELLISLVYNENLNRLSATVIEARRLKLISISAGPHPIQPRSAGSELESGNWFSQSTHSTLADHSKDAGRFEMSEVKDVFILPRVEMANGTNGHPAVIDIVDPLFVRKQNMPPPPMSAPDVVRAARVAFRTGKTKPLKYRKEQLKALLKFFEECRADIEDALYKDLRKHPQEVNIAEIILVTNDIRHTLMDLDEWAKPKRPSKRLINMCEDVQIHSDPYGVVLIIGAWNYPLLLTLGPLVGALAAGNCIVMKPSELSAATAELLHRLLTKYLDPDTFHVVLGGIPETTDLLSERFDYIFFTGSTTVGKIVHQAAAQHLTPTTLELGGKSPCYIDNTVDMQLAAKRVIWGKFMNAGQTCICPDYILCTKEVQKEFLNAAEAVLKEFYCDQKFPSDMSKIISENHFKRLLKFLDNGNVAIGGQYLESQNIISPTILINVKKSDKVMSEEIFGPILPILNVTSCDEAIEYINENEKPLALYIFSEEDSVQKRFLEETSSGSVSINDTIMQICTENLPFGGVGASGMGAYHGEEGFKTFSHQKSVLKTMLNSFSELGFQSRYPPYSEAKINLLNMVMKKRRGIPLKYFSNALIFLLGFGVAYGFHRLFHHDNDSSQ